MTDIMIVAVLLVVLGLAARYVIKAKKSGRKCIGCTESACPHAGKAGCVCGGDKN